MKKSILIISAFVFCFESFSQNTKSIENIVGGNEVAEENAVAEDKTPRVSDYEIYSENGFTGYKNSKKGVDIQFMKIELGKTALGFEIMKFIQDSKELSLLSQEIVLIDDEKTILYTVTKSEDGNEFREYILITGDSLESTLFKGTSEHEESIIEDLKLIVMSLKEGY